MSTPQASEPLVSVSHLRKYFPVRRGLFSRVVGWVRAVDDLSFEIRRGETLGLVGESGCGKTTVGRTILRLVEPTEGRVRILGHDVTATGPEELRQLRRHMQIVFQDPYSSLNPRLTIQAILEEGLIVHGLDKRAERHERVHEILRQVGLDRSYSHRYPHEFSGGQRQRISIARALVLNPKFIVLDEPISALDVSIQSQVINLLIDLREKYDLTYSIHLTRLVGGGIHFRSRGRDVSGRDRRDGGQRRNCIGTRCIPTLTRCSRPCRCSTRPASGLRIVLPGDVPSPVNPPSGCRFHPRCPLAMPVCRTTVPPELNLDGHRVRCHAVSEEAERLGNDPAWLSEFITAKMASSPVANSQGSPAPAG